MSGIQALAAAAAATSKINTPGTATTLTTSSGQSIKLIQQPGLIATHLSWFEESLFCKRLNGNYNHSNPTIEFYKFWAFEAWAREHLLTLWGDLSLHNWSPVWLDWVWPDRSIFPLRIVFSANGNILELGTCDDYLGGGKCNQCLMFSLIRKLNQALAIVLGLILKLILQLIDLLI